jgi:hypothetical protein
VSPAATPHLLTLFAVLAIACWVNAAASTSVIEDDPKSPTRQRQFVRAIAYRFEAIETAFGPLSDAFGARVNVVFKSDDEQKRSGTMFIASYVPESNTLVFSTRVLASALPDSSRFLAQYWPLYKDELVRSEFPVLELIDTALWDAFLQEAASRTGESWPAKECTSPEIATKLPCHMMVRAVFEYSRQLRPPLFNENRIDRVLPDNFAEFCRRSRRATSHEYEDVERYGGILLLKPLISEFGVPRTLAYAARTPFSVQENNMRMSVLRYQERARAALTW